MGRTFKPEAFMWFTQAGHVPWSTSVVVPAIVFLSTSQCCAHLQRKNFFFFVPVSFKNTSLLKKQTKKTT